MLGCRGHIFSAYMNTYIFMSQMHADITDVYLHANITDDILTDGILYQISQDLKRVQTSVTFKEVIRTPIPTVIETHFHTCRFDVIKHYIHSLW